MIFYFLCCSVDSKYEYFCTTGNKNFKCVSLKSIFFKLDDISRFSWPIDLKFRDLAPNEFQNLMFFSIFLSIPHKRQKAQGKSIFKIQNAAMVLIF